MKLLGMMLMVLTTTGFGVAAGQRLHNRVHTLELLCGLAKYLAEKVRYTAAPLSVLFSQAARETAFAPLLFLQAAAHHDAREAMCRAASETAVSLGLNNEDSRLLMEFLDGFGQADAAGENERCRHYAALFTKRGEAAQREYTQKSTLYVTLGVCGGSMAALLLGG